MEAKQLSKAKSKTQAKHKGPAKTRRKAAKPAYLKRKMQVSNPEDAEEKEADRVAADVKRNTKSTPEGQTPPVDSAQRVVRRSATDQMEEPQEAQKKLMRTEEKEEEAQPKLMRMNGEEDEEAQPKLMRMNGEEEEEAQPKLMRMNGEEEEEAQPKLMRMNGEEEEEAQPKLMREEQEEEEAQAKLLRQAEMDETQETAMAKLLRQIRKQAQQPSAEQEQETPGDTLEQRIQNSRGNGSPLPDTVLKDMEQQFDKNFSKVVIHNDNEAGELCKELNARAFTIGNDIYFAPGEFTPETDGGRELMAHELTHVIQQGRHVTRKVYRSNGSSGSGGSAGSGGSGGSGAGGDGNGDGSADTYTVSAGDYSGTRINTQSGNRSLSLPKLNLPSLKQRNSGLFPVPLPVSQERRPRTAQTANFRTAVNGSVTTEFSNLASNARSRNAVESDPGSGQEMFFFTHNQNNQFVLFGTQENLLPRLEIPFWDSSGHGTNFQVDHIREMQLRGNDDDSNYELLEGDANMGAGRAIAAEIRDNIKGGLTALKEAFPDAPIPAARRWSSVKRTYTVSFASLDWNLPHDGSANGNRCWSVQAITGGDHMENLRPMNREERSAVGAGGPPQVFASEQGGEPLPDISNPRQDWIPRVDLVNWTPSDDEGASTLGTLVVSAFKAKTARQRSSGIATSPDYPNQSWPVKRIPGMNAGYIESASYIQGIRNSLRLPGMSPIELDSVTMSSAGIQAEGRVLPSVPLISQADIRVSISGEEASIFKTFSIEEFNVPAPFSVENCGITVFYSSTRGLGIEGQADFSVDNLGEGYLGAAASTQGGFELEGGFNFDSNLFDRASIDLWYRNDRFGARGTIGIDQPNKIKGIRSASITAEYSDDAFSAEGDVQPDIPGIQQVGLNVAYSEEAGLTIGGTLQLSANPAIRSGSIEVTVNKQGDDWKVGATGTAEPAIPGIDSQLTVGYDDGAFTAEFSGAYQRGMLSGQVTVGASNRAVGEDGRPSGDPMPDGALNIYGSGSATIQIAPWLQGTAGIRFDPNGEVTVSGEIGIPNELEIFARREINKSIFNIAVQIPIVPGIVAEVGGGLTAVAGIGPGVIDQLSIGITYNPAHEQDTRVTGDAHLRVPADAGLRLSVRAGIGLGITGASATGGLEVGGTLGIEGAAEAGVHLDWTPSEGLDLTANLSIYAQPSFTFDISGYVSVRALGFSVYDQRWQLASYSFGSDYRFGISLPVHYHEGEPFDISLDDVQFEVPDIDTNQLLSGLISRIT